MLWPDPDSNPQPLWVGAEREDRSAGNALDLMVLEKQECCQGNWWKKGRFHADDQESFWSSICEIKCFCDHVLLHIFPTRIVLNISIERSMINCPLFLLIFFLSKRWLLCSPAYFQLPSNQEEIPSQGGTFWWRWGWGVFIRGDRGRSFVFSGAERTDGMFEDRFDTKSFLHVLDNRFSLYRTRALKRVWTRTEHWRFKKHSMN